MTRRRGTDFPSMRALGNPYIVIIADSKELSGIRYAYCHLNYLLKFCELARQKCPTVLCYK